MITADLELTAYVDPFAHSWPGLATADPDSFLTFHYTTCSVSVLKNFVLSPIRLTFFDTAAGAEAEHRNFRRAARLQDPGAGVRGAARGHDVVHEADVLSGESAFETGRERKAVLEHASAGSAVRHAHGTRRAGLDQQTLLVRQFQMRAADSASSSAWL